MAEREGGKGSYIYTYSDRRTGGGGRRGGGGERGEDGQLWCYECWCEDKESSLINPPADIFSKVRHFGKLHAFSYTS